MAKDWKAEDSPTMQAINNSVVRLTDERTQKRLDRIQRLRDIRLEILAEISKDNLVSINSSVNDDLQDAIKFVDMAITRIEIAEQQVKGE